jgi:hypothetical protein
MGSCPTAEVRRFFYHGSSSLQEAFMSGEDIKVTDTPRTSERAGASQEREMLEWAKTLRISPAQLKQAVSAVGITPRKIREYLRRNQ